jgi:CubicO group peptidase (beta-lactamase class C family)
MQSHRVGEEELMQKHLWFSLIASLFVQCAIGQTDGSAARHEKAVEENLRYLAVIKGRPDPGMSLVDQMLRLHVPGVSIAVIHDKRIDWSNGYGVARLGGPPVSASILFGAASMSKPVTAMAVLRLVQEDKIHLDVDVNTYLKSWKIPANEYTKNHAVTVRELFAGGLPSKISSIDGTPLSGS